MKKKEEIKQTIKSDKADFIKFLILFGCIAVCIAIFIYMIPWIISLKDAAGREAFKAYIESKGAAGVLILLGVQILQVVVAIIPGEPIEIIAGLLYGTLGGYLICTIGMLIGTIIIFYMVKLLGVSFLSKLINIEKMKKYKFLNETKRLEMVTFILFFIPGTPKDLLTYFMPLTQIKPFAFFSIATLARIPSVVSSTFAGASIGDGQWARTIVIFVIIGAVGLLGIFLNDRLMKRLDRKKEKQKNEL